jgi:hypothetical protein
MYQLTLCNPDGTLVAIIPDNKILPRYLHVTAGFLYLSDMAVAPDEIVDPVTTFARVASSVHVDDDRAALFVRVPA